MIRRILRIATLFVLVALAALATFLFFPSIDKNPEISWGVSFSPAYAEDFGLNWREAYEAILFNLGADRVRFALHWSFFEPESGAYQRDDLRWILQRAEEAGASLMLAVGMKTPRWPECHIPPWAEDMSKEEQQGRILDLLKIVAETANPSSALELWQIENEPFFDFGVCPWRDDKFVQTETDLIRNLDTRDRPVVITESGEQSWWLKAARIADIVGVTTYRQTWIHEIGVFFRSPLPPTFYGRKAWLINKLAGKPVIGVELQAEPWGPRPLFVLPPDEHLAIFDIENFRDNIAYAQATGIDTFYLWGAEWWYWQKETQGNASFWNEARKLWR